MKLSARNQFEGTIVKIIPGAVNAVVGIEIAKNVVVTASITMHAVEELQLAEGKKAYAIIKATNVMVGLDEGALTISARNQWKGTITKVVPGAVNAIVSLEVAPNVVVTSSITMNAVEELGLVAGKEAVAVVKASSVMVGIA